MKKQLLLLVMMMLPLVASAYDIEVKNADGVTIYYNYIKDVTELEVTFGTRPNSALIYDYYKGNVVIPEEVTIMNRTRKVTSIGKSAFYRCNGLTSITIPNSVTSIDNSAFRNCTGLTSVTIPNSVTSIGDWAFDGCWLTSVTIGKSVKSIGEKAFYDCYRLTSVQINDLESWCKILFDDNDSNPLSRAQHLYLNGKEIKNLVIPNSVTTINKSAFINCNGLTSVTIPNSVMYIRSSAFAGCSGLTSITIPNSVIDLGESSFEYCRGLTSVTIPNSVKRIRVRVFYSCTGLTSITIPNSVTSIDNSAFSGCTSLTSVTTPNSVTSIGKSAFSGCSALTSIYIPNSVTSIGESAFENCSSLTSITIPNSVSSIGWRAFAGADIPTVISLIEKPFKIYGKSSTDNTFSPNTFNNATLYVPKGTIDKYKTTDGWKDFVFIEEGTGGSVTPPTPEKCEKPTIGYNNGNLTFTSSTDGATCQYSITDSDIKSGSGSGVQLTATYHISVYATKTGYENSDVATATLCWIDQQPRTEGITNGIAQVPANAVLIQSSDGILTIQGTDDGTPIAVYTLNGQQAGSAISQNGQAIIGTTLQPGSVAIVKIGQKSVKVVVK